MALYIQALNYENAKKSFDDKRNENYEDDKLVVTIAYPKIGTAIEITFTENNEAYIWSAERGGIKYWIRNKTIDYKDRWELIFKWAVLGCRKNWYNCGKYNAVNMLYWLKKY